MLPAKRGSRVCSSCGCTNGNRASVCKACHKAFISINRVEGEPLHRNPAKRTSSDVSSLIPPDLQPKPQKLYSVRIRDRGPDYRTYVAVTDDQKWQCHYTSCKAAQDSRLRSVPLGSASSCHTCNHIQWAQQPSINNNHDTCLTLDLEKLPELPFPKKTREELELLFHTSGGSLLQRVSEEMFLVRNAQPTQEHQFGVLHVRFSLKSKNAAKAAAPPMFICPCSAYKRFSSLTAHAGGGTTPRLSKRCIHYYICLWAFACNRSLAEEFHQHLAPDLESRELHRLA